MIGIRIVDPVTGVTRLDAEDYTVRVVYESLRIINANESINVPGITHDNAGAFLCPAYQAGYPISNDWDANGRNLPKMPAVLVSDNTVSWQLGNDHTPNRLWQILVVRYK